MKTPLLHFAATLTISLVSCHKLTPAGFRKNYKEDFLVQNLSNQGPYGGHRAMHWRADKPNTFSSHNIINFAVKNDWHLVDSFQFQEEQTMIWTYNGSSVFPLTSAGFSNTVSNNPELEHFPRWFGGKIKLYRFRTGWIIIEPGEGDLIAENGFVLINSDKTEMAVYHLWGE